MAAQLDKKNGIDQTDISEYLKNRDDFAFELQTLQPCKATQTKRILTEHGGSYSDPISSKPRQFDIRAQFERGWKLCLAVECKRLNPWFPLVVSYVPRTHSESFHQVIRILPNHVRKLDQEGREIGTIIRTIPGTQSIYRQGEAVGKATIQIGRDKQQEFISHDAEIYDKWAQAVSSASEWIIRLAANRPANLTGEETLALVLPTLVVADDML